MLMDMVAFQIIVYEYNTYIVLGLIFYLKDV